MHNNVSLRKIKHEKDKNIPSTFGKNAQNRIPSCYINLNQNAKDVLDIQQKGITVLILAFALNQKCNP